MKHIYHHYLTGQHLITDVNPAYNINTLSGTENILIFAVDSYLSYLILNLTDERIITDVNPAYNIHTLSGTENILIFAVDGIYHI